MLFWTIIKVSFKSLITNRLRSVLAMLGIIIGVAAVISMLAIGAGAKHQVMERVTSMGTNVLVLRPGQRGSRGVTIGISQNLTLEDASAILDSVSTVSQVSPVIRGSAQLKYFNKNTRSSVIGSSITYFPIRNFEVESGRVFTESEVETGAKVALIGPVTAQNLFGTLNPVHEIIKVNKLNFEIVGVLKAKGDQGWNNPDDQIIVPYTTAMKQLFGLLTVNEIHIQGQNENDLNAIQEEITTLIRKRHRIQSGMPDDFEIRNQAELIDMASEFSQTFTILLGSIASISLLVGGIGIMNIMLVTVTERTREIGIRKAIGAKERHIMQQFLLESMIMTILGGVLGVGLGVGVSEIIERNSQFAVKLESFSIILALSFSSSIGIFFGYYPARRAARLDPIQALRYE